MSEEIEMPEMRALNESIAATLADAKAKQGAGALTLAFTVVPASSRTAFILALVEITRVCSFVDSIIVEFGIKFGR